MIDSGSSIVHEGSVRRVRHSTRHWMALGGTSQSRRSLAPKACYELDEISPVMQGFVIDRVAAGRVGSSLDAKDRALSLDFQRCSDLDPGWHRVQFVLGLDQR